MATLAGKEVLSQKTEKIYSAYYAFQGMHIFQRTYEHAGLAQEYL